jgi:pimeloyl-ACP methyl ester carboxylesterase
MPFVQTDDDVSLFFRDWGEGEPVMFCAAWALTILENEALYFGDELPGCDISPLLRDWTEADMLNTTLQAAIEFQRSAVETDFRAELPTLSLPTLVIQGDADASAPLPVTGARTAETAAQLPPAGL